MGCSSSKNAAGAATPRPNQPLGWDFKVSLERRPGDQLGLSVVVSTDVASARSILRVEAIKEIGLVPSFNEALDTSTALSSSSSKSPSQRIQVGDRVVAVNDVSSDVLRMMKELEQQVVVIAIQRANAAGTTAAKASRAEEPRETLPSCSAQEPQPAAETASSCVPPPAAGPLEAQGSAAQDVDGGAQTPCRSSATKSSTSAVERLKTLKKTVSFSGLVEVSDYDTGLTTTATCMKQAAAIDMAESGTMAADLTADQAEEGGLPRTSSETLAVGPRGVFVMINAKDDAITSTLDAPELQETELPQAQAAVHLCRLDFC
eukprot:TRINITY_DN20927_c0_g1_i1.p1 TRINITY_DN20927_c0_g1~~TRINITY_DN20927_c0_g1_i1.p1  ORF type:complete len:318 (+),score=66.58 TRINITY_DN20927_c0_g1_i1:76-1029(+)